MSTVPATPPAPQETSEGSHGPQADADSDHDRRHPDRQLSDGGGQRRLCDTPPGPPATHADRVRRRSSRPNRADWEKIETAARLRADRAGAASHRTLQGLCRVPRAQRARLHSPARPGPVRDRRDIPVQQPARPRERLPGRELEPTTPSSRQAAVHPRLRSTTINTARSVTSSQRITQRLPSAALETSPPRLGTVSPRPVAPCSSPTRGHRGARFPCYSSSRRHGWSRLRDATLTPPISLSQTDDVR